MNHGRSAPGQNHHLSQQQHGVENDHRARERGHHGHPQHHGAPPHQQRHGHGQPHGDRPPPPPQQSSQQRHPPPPNYHSYKVLIDPMIHRVPEKQIRYDGVTVPGNPHHMSPSPSDPRKKPIPSLWRRMEDLDLPIPRFVIDDNYVGEPPKVEVTMDNLNDNIDKQFLSNRIEKFGDWEELHIDYHPVSKKHLGLARIVFKHVQGAKDCVAGLHGKSIMGKLVNCYLDPRFLMAKKMFIDLTTDKKPSPLPEVEEENEEPEENLVTATNDNFDDYNDNVGDDYDYDYHERDRGGGWGERDKDRNSRDGWSHNQSDSKDWNDHHNDDWSDRHNDGWDDNRRRGRHWHYGDNDDEYDRGDNRSRHRGSRWDKEDDGRGDGVRWGRGRQERGGRKSRWDREDRNSRDHDSRDRDRYENDSRDGRQENESRNPNFWAEAAAKFAAASGDFDDDNAQHADDVAPVAGAEAVPGEDDGHTIDLDTRLQMLMKNKSANMPAFLIPSDSSDEDGADKAPPATSASTAPLSRAPSPFLSQEEYMKSYQATLSADQLEKVNTALNDANVGKFNDDKMSLSPLSEGGDLAELPDNHHDNHHGHQFPGQPGYWPGGGYYPHAGAGGGYYPQDYQDQWGGQYPNYHYNQWGDQYSHYNEEQERKERAKKKFAGKNPLRVIIDNVLHIVESELKLILKKDINKRVCETYAFLLFDNWWTEQETKYKEKQEREAAKLKKSDPAPVVMPADKEKVAELPRIPKPEDLTSLIDKRRAHLDNKGAIGGSLGLGFRGTIPKLATVQRKQRSPSPKGESSKERTKDKDKSPKKKNKHKEKEREKSKSPTKEDAKTTSKSIFKEIYSDSDESNGDKNDSSSSSSEVLSSDDSDSDSDVSKSSDVSDDEDDSDSKASSKSASRSSSQSKSKSRSRSRSKSGSRSGSITKVSTPTPEPDGSVPTSPKETAPSSPKVAVSPRRSALAKKVDSSTDSAEEDFIQETPVTPSTPVKVKHVTSSPPHITDHCYASMEDHCYARKTTSTNLSDTESDPDVVEVGGGGGDHDYTTPRTPPKATPAVVQSVKQKQRKPSTALVSRPALPVKPIKWKQREYNDKFQIIYKFLTNGVDAEDIMYLKKSYEMMLNEGLSQPNLAWINDTHWVDHPITNIPDPPAKKRRLEDTSRPHRTGSARTEGYYKMDPREKARTKYHFHRSGVDAFNIAKLGTKEQQKPQKALTLSREARNEQRRLLNALGDDCLDSNLLQFNTLKFRRKAMRFGKSAIHDWGLFAMEHIGADEMVIEYVGDVIRPVLSDDREKRYEKQGIGSSYLFRIDQDYVVDATKCGNLARFINHSCEPNCYAKVIKIDGSSKIVIYSKQTIAIGEEITYDYKFPLEEEKIRCLCGSKNCKKYLN